jgi:hypothetical protein
MPCCLLALFLLPQSSNPIFLEEGRELQRSLAGDSEVYVLDLEAGDREEGAVWQQSVDVEIDVIGPDDNFIDTFDFFSLNVDPFRFHALTDGEYQVRVHAVDDDSGLYQIRIHLSGPEAADRVGKAQQFLNRYFHTLQGTQVAVIQQAGFRFDDSTQTWFLELRNAVYMLYPQWAMEKLEAIFLSEEGWPLEHPGETMGIGVRGGAAPVPTP